MLGYIFLGGLTVVDLQRGAAVLPDRLRLLARSSFLGLKAASAAGRACRRARRGGHGQRLRRRRLDDILAHLGAPRPTRWASSGSAWRWASASSCRSATGAPTSWSCSGPMAAKLDDRGAAHAAHRRRPEDALPVPRHRARA
ncbi:MAG: hypothetical protein MZV49_06320 [Rhodopseudomonas palustris]|nr:hypothetical protein [Rhodopseudomonas palustris]